MKRHSESGWRFRVFDDFAKITKYGVTLALDHTECGGIKAG